MPSDPGGSGSASADRGGCGAGQTDTGWTDAGGTDARMPDGGGVAAAGAAPPSATWQSIRDTALERLRSGAWAPGARIPTEATLAAEFGCARATVNRALRDLADAGYLDRRRRSGTRVVRHPVRKATLAIPVIRLEVEGAGRRHSHTVLWREAGVRPPPAVRRAMGPGTPARLLHLRALHGADGAPHALEDRWINTAAVPGILRVDLTGISANEWLVGHVPYTRGRLDLSAAAAPAEDAAHLGCAPGAAVFTLERTTWVGETPITWVRVTYPPGHRLTMEI